MACLTFECHSRLSSASPTLYRPSRPSRGTAPVGLDTFLARLSFSPLLAIHGTPHSFAYKLRRQPDNLPPRPAPMIPSPPPYRCGRSTPLAPVFFRTAPPWPP